MTKYFSQREIGFTFIELLIVIAVLGILAAVIIPNVSGFILSGKVAAANSEVLSIRTAIRAYQAENSVTYIPPVHLTCLLQMSHLTSVVR